MITFFATVGLAVIGCHLASAQRTDDQVNSYRNLGSFQNPSAHARPRFRYWIPDASVNFSTVRNDIAEAGRVGAGGVELLGYYNYGDIEAGDGIIPTDWTQYGWGTPKWRELQDVALQATKDNGLIIDLSLGPNQGAGVPAPVNANGLQWDLQPFNSTIEIGDTFSGVLPGWGTGELVSASTGLVVQTTNSSSGLTYTLSADSLQEVTKKVSSNGELKIEFPSNVTGKHFVVFAYYLVHTQYREQQTPELVTSGEGVQQSPVTSFVQNGSWVVDHFSAAGAKLVADFWTEHLLNGGDSAELIRRVGEYIWEDSQEFPSNVLWTPKVPESFLAHHGYSVLKYLPVLMHDNGGGISITASVAPPAFNTDDTDQDAKHAQDFRQTMTELNQDYLKGLTQFAQSLGVQSSTQVAYNFPLDMLANIPFVNAPETETLGFNHDIDSYRQFTGPAGLAGKRVISSEAGAVMLSVYQQTVPELLWDLKRSVVGGINAFVLHGMPFSGYYPNTTWPSYVTFSYLFSEMHNRHQPGWDYYRDFIDYTARVQHVMQSGVAKVDLVFWSKKTSYVAVPSVYQPNDLTRAGYTYEYLSPDNFFLPAAFVDQGRLAPDAQAFKALIIRGNDTLTAAGVTKLCQWARQGLPVVFSGGIPTNVSGTIEPAKLKSILSDLGSLKKLQNVHSVPFEELAKSLTEIGIKPRTFTANEDVDAPIWYTRWRESKNETAVFIYNDATGVTSGTPFTQRSLTFAATGRPYLYDAWTGEQTPLAHFSQTKNETTIELTLAGNQSSIIAFRKSESYHRPSAYLRKKRNTVFDAIKLAKWTLTIESWTAPSDFSIDGTVKTNTTYEIDALLPWNELTVANLTYVAGRGYYRTSFTWPSGSSSAEGAFISMDAVLHTAVLYINGIRTMALDVTAPNVDVTKYLKEGLNTVEIVISTPLGNALIPIKDQVQTIGASLSAVAAATSYDLLSIKQYGLVGEVLLTPY